jgi:hypothetical protein
MPLNAPPSVLPDIDLPAVKITAVEPAPKKAKPPRVLGTVLLTVLGVLVVQAIALVAWLLLR